MNFLYIMVEDRPKKAGGGSGCNKEKDFRYREKNLTIIQDNEQHTGLLL